MAVEFAPRPHVEQYTEQLPPHQEHAVFTTMTDIAHEEELRTSLVEKPSRVDEASAEWLKPSEQIQHPTGIELINTRLWMSDLSDQEGRQVTIGSVPESEWKDMFEKYDSFWFMGIYTPSEFSRNHAKKYAHQYTYAKPDINPDQDVVASPFAIPEYQPSQEIAQDWKEWDQMVDKLHHNDKKVFVDFVPNHTAVDHHWVKEHPEYFIQGSDEQKSNHPDLYYTVEDDDGTKMHIAHGRDPNFPEWSDTLQLNYARPEVQEAMVNQLLDLVEHADGVRCDMAMLLNADTFIRTWGNHLSDDEKTYISENSFWPKAVEAAKEKAVDMGRSDFYFVAEAYWDKDILGQSFDYMYDKDFYDHLVRIAHGDSRVSAVSLKNHIEYLMNDEKGQQGLRFVENHDEERAVHVFGKEPSKAAAAITAFIPNGLFLLNQGQEDGRRIRPPMQIKSFPVEEPDPSFQNFYDGLLTLKHTKLFQEGVWKLAELKHNNSSIIAQQVEAITNNEEDKKKLEIGAVVCTNFGNQYASCRMPDIGAEMDVKVYSLTEGKEILHIDDQRKEGIYVGLIPWESQVVVYTPKVKAEIS